MNFFTMNPDLKEFFFDGGQGGGGRGGLSKSIFFTKNPFFF